MGFLARYGSIFFLAIGRRMKDLGSRHVVMFNPSMFCSELLPLSWSVARGQLEGEKRDVGQGRARLEGLAALGKISLYIDDWPREQFIANDADTWYIASWSSLY